MHIHTQQCSTELDVHDDTKGWGGITYASFTQIQPANLKVITLVVLCVRPFSCEIWVEYDRVSGLKRSKLKNIVWAKSRDSTGKKQWVSDIT